MPTLISADVVSRAVTEAQGKRISVPQSDGVKRQDLPSDGQAVSNTAQSSQTLFTEQISQNQESENSEQQLLEVVEQLNNRVQTVARDLEFTVDQENNQVIVKVSDTETGEVVRQIPSEEALRIAENLAELTEQLSGNPESEKTGLFFQAQA